MTFAYFQTGCACLRGAGHSTRCYNLLKNPSFEEGLSGWTASDNVQAGNELPFEGTQLANFLAGVAHLYQDVSLAGTGNSPLFLSFNLLSDDQPDFTVEVLWLDEERHPIGSGLRMFIPANTTNNTFGVNSRITFFAVTDRPTSEASYARLLFSKAAGGEESIVFLDQVLLTRIKTGNLVNNPGFEVGLADWEEPAPAFQPNFTAPLEGAGNALTTEDGTLSQDVPIDHQPAGASYLFSFGAFVSGPFPGGHYLPVQVQVLWLDQGGNIINTSEANLNLDLRTLGIQINYLTYLDLTDPAPAGAVAARILFTPTIEEQQSFFKVDQVLLARAGSGNLVENPSFESGADGWTLVNAQAGLSNHEAYEGINVAVIDPDGGAVIQDVPLVNAAGNCYLLSFGLRVVSYGPVVNSSDVLIKVLWLDERGREIGVGLNLVAFVMHPDTMFFGQWLVYTGITEEAPVGTAAARLQFSKPAGGIAPVEIDHVVFGRLV